MLIDDTDNSRIKGVIANFGKTPLDIKKEINVRENLIVNIDQLIETKLNYEDKITREIDKIIENKKGKSRLQKMHPKNIFKLLNFYQKFVFEAKKIESSEEALILINGNNSFETEKEQKQSINIPIISKIDDSKIKECSEILIKKI